MASERPLQVLHLTSGSDAGGVSRYLVDLCTAMSAEGHDVTVAGHRGAAHALFEQANIRWIEVPLGGGPLALWRTVEKLRKHLEKHPVDLLHTHYRRSTLVARRLQLHHTPPILYTLHLSDMPLGWRKWLSDFGDRTHAPSEGARRWLVDVAGVAPERVSVVTHGVRVESFPVATAAERSTARRSLGFSDNDLVAAYVGRFDTPKNENWLLDLAQTRQCALPNLKLLLQGEGPHEPEVRRQIETAGLSDRVRLVSPGDPRPTYVAAHALLLPSEREGFSLACAEAMCTGTPVLRTATAGAAELIVENVTGRSCPIDHDAFIAAAQSFLADPAALALMGDAAACHIRDRFTLTRQVEETISLYRHVIAEA